jgi:transcriptional regulator with XRE-family HTH domain
MARLPGQLIREARVDAGLTQADLARRLGTTQSAIARLEANDSNPTVTKLADALRAAGRDLEIASRVTPQPVDETLIAAGRRMTPEQRLDNFAQAYRNTQRLVLGSRRLSG